ncbi:unnamed protein product [Arabidopsis arenosa]|uniref:Uncharacterized protein n=1 Tax=Arabidopsis arenosa TaxID=38785 RepID=A0A8S2B4T9_ARAAE|nr:unnamed protein product [Arabidopsis arenosa]
MGSGRYLDDPLTFTRNPPPRLLQSPNLAFSANRSLALEASRVRAYEEAMVIALATHFALEKLAGTVQFYERHVFLCYKKPSVWPARIEASEFDRLPRLLSSVYRRGRVGRLRVKRHFFEEILRSQYRRLTHFDVDTFVEEVLVKDVEWLPGNPESLSGEVSVSPCSHIGGHKYTGDVIIYGLNINQRVTGHWYGCVTLENVPLLLEQHINKGEIVDRLWRGEMGLPEEDQKKTQEQSLELSQSLTVLVANKMGTSYCCAAMSMWLESWEKEDTYAALAVACAAASVAIAYNCYKQLK